jgi:hypothetical protein
MWRHDDKGKYTDFAVVKYVASIKQAHKGFYSQIQLGGLVKDEEALFV